MPNNGEYKICFKGFHLIDGVPVCDKFARDAEYPVGKFVEIPESAGELKICENGIHVCTEPLDCFRFYDPGDMNFGIGIVDAYGMSDEEDHWTTKRVCRGIMVKEVETNYKGIGLLVKCRTVGTRCLSFHAAGDLMARNHTDVITYDDRVWAHGCGWTIGDEDDILMTAGRYCYISGNEDTAISVAMTFGSGSVAVGSAAIAFGPVSMARTVYQEGVALTRKCSSIAVADGIMSIAVAGNAYSRAVANKTFSTAVAVQASSIVVLDKPGTVGVSYGSALVNARGCTVILMPSKFNDPLGAPSHFWYGTGSIRGVDGTCVVVYDFTNEIWRRVYLREGDPTYKYKANVELDIQWLVEQVRKDPQI